jgi:hypothetical protein
MCGLSPVLPETCKSRRFVGEPVIFHQQFFLALDTVGILRDAIDRTDFDALRGIVMADTFRAQIGIDNVDIITL